MLFLWVSGIGLVKPSGSELLWTNCPLCVENLILPLAMSRCPCRDIVLYIFLTSRSSRSLPQKGGLGMKAGAICMHHCAGTWWAKTWHLQVPICGQIVGFKHTLYQLNVKLLSDQRCQFYQYHLHKDWIALIKAFKMNPMSFQIKDNSRGTWSPSCLGIEVAMDFVVSCFDENNSFACSGPSCWV